ncbi:Molybdate-anion transporter [Cytospora mali]|uniref:Molybdate-anion transporter n=1 Tax=Cytospora mali TaxID=578113 RepID=A0A194URW9_CYTMA|nr:Molybdate-anion transporter [Valsa mali var. pyri (nom. inval.)]
MQLDIYWTTLLILLPAVVLLTGRNIIIQPFVRIQSKWRKVDTEDKPDAPIDSEQEEKSPKHDDEPRNFRHAFLTVYLLVMSSEWLSGPYLYALLRDDKALSESVVIGLYATAYTSAAMSATVTGFLADRYGRRRAGIAQCGIHSLACLTVIFGGNCLPVLFVGRVLAGTALTMLWTVFESWMVTEWNSRGLGRDDSEEGGLGKMFGLMTTANCMAAIVGGVLGHCMVSVMGSKLWPFWAGINENYGVTHEPKSENEDSVVEGSNESSILQKAHIVALAKTNPGSPNEIPYGVIFAALMAAMILGALLFNASSRRGVPPVWLLMTGVLVAICSLLFLAILGGEVALFCAFLLFEVANGLYVPSIAYLRGLVVDEKSRTGMYGLMKIPLFIFVILALGITAEVSIFLRLFVGQRLYVAFQALAIEAILVIHVVISIAAKIVEIHLIVIVAVLVALGGLVRLLFLNILPLHLSSRFLLLPPLLPRLLKLFDLFLRLVDVLVPHDLSAAEAFLDLGQPKLHPRSQLNKLYGPTLHFVITMSLFFLLIVFSRSSSGRGPCSCDLLLLVSLKDFDLGICVCFAAARSICCVSITILAAYHIVCDILELAKIGELSFPALAVH